jgi:hypoxanthine phosphoribosyltransferase
MHDDIKTVLFDEDAIRTRVHDLGRTISRELRGRDLVLLALLKGGVVFLADLIRAMEVPLRLDFAWVSSYGDGTRSTQDVQLKVFPDEDFGGRTVLVVDDILDTGRTLDRVVRKLREEHGAADVLSCVLLDKKARREVALEADYVGFRVDDFFVVGYGLDYGDRYRNLPYIGVLEDRCYLEAGGAREA